MNTLKNILRGFKFLFLVIVYSILSAVLSACSPQARLDRLVRNHPELLNHSDTVYLTDTIVVPKISLDTVFSANFDTVYINRDKMQVKIIKHRDTIRVSVTKLADTVYKPIKVPYKAVEAKQDTKSKEQFFVIFGVLCLISMLVMAFSSINKKRKKDDSNRDN